MKNKFEQMIDIKAGQDEKSLELLGKLAEVAKPEAVFSKPLQAGSMQVITASEVQLGMGFGFGVGSGPEVTTAADEGGVTTEQQEETGMGGGGGGGGGASGRPIAVISIREEGVEVEPIIDTTKIALAFFTTLGSMFFMLSGMKKAFKK